MDSTIPASAAPSGTFKTNVSFEIGPATARALTVSRFGRCCIPCYRHRPALLTARIPRQGHCHGNGLAIGAGEGESGGMKPPPNPHYRHRFPAELISDAVRLYHVFSLSLRDVELLFAGRGIVVS